MDQLKSISAIALLITLFACGNKEEASVIFSEPQPVETENLSQFPKRLVGQYRSPADNSILSIQDKLISRIYDYDQRIPMAQLDSTLQLSGDTLINLKTNDKTVIKREGDTLVIHNHYIDTVFQINYYNVVRKLKGHYFLNERYDEGSWEVKKLDLTRGKLTIGRISSNPEIETLKAITETQKDTIFPLKFVLSKKQFKDFIKKDGFGDSETFMKVK
jgi:hypothetical protein